MADNVTADPGAGGATFASDDIGGVQYPRTKLTLGADGGNDGDVSDANPIPAKVADGNDVVLGATTDAAVDSNAVGTVSGKLRGLVKILASVWDAANGRLKVDGSAVTQPVSAAALPLPAGAATAAAQATGNASLTSIDGKLSGPLNVTGSAVTATGTVTANLGTIAGVATEVTLATRAADATLTGGLAKAIARGGAKGTTVAADITSTPSGANHQPGDVILYDAAGNAIDPRLIRAIASGTDSITVVQGAPGATAWKVDGSGVTQPVSGTVTANLAAGVNNIGDVDVLSLPSIPAGTNNIGDVDVLSLPSIPAGANNIGDVDVLTLPAVAGGKTNNNAAPGATNVGVLGALANAAVPVWTEGNLVSESIDLSGAQRVVLRPDVVLGAYSVGGSVGYTAVTAGGIIFSFRWGDATRKCRIIRVTVQVVATAFTTAGLVERQLVVVRAFTASDTGGAAVTPAANMSELQTAFGTSLLTDARFGGFLAAGTGTADTNPLATVSGWMAAVGNVIGGASLVPLYEHRQGKKPWVLAQNEGFRIRLGAAESASTRQTFVNVEWDEGNNFE